MAMLASLLQSLGQCVPLTVHGGGAFYTAPLNVGSPVQKLNVIPDTGSYDLLLDSTFCHQQGCMRHVQYDANKSHTATNPTKTDRLAIVPTAYGQGEVVSISWRDSVELGSMRANQCDMLVMMQEQLRGWDDPGDSFDGIMGIGRLDDTGNSAHQTALLTTMNIDYFTMCLGEMGRVLDGGRLELNGGSLHNTLKSRFVSAASTGERSWATELTHASAMSGDSGTPEAISMNACRPGPGGTCGVIIDSGTTLLTFPPTLLTAVRATIDVLCPKCLRHLEEQETCEGNHYNRLPVLNLTLGGIHVTLEPRIYMSPMEVTLAGITKMGPFTFPFTVPGVRCVPLFSSVEQLTNIGPLIIMGMPFLRVYATLFNRSSESMSFAQLTEAEGTSLCGKQCDGGDAERRKRRFSRHNRRNRFRGQQQDNGEQELKFPLPAEAVLQPRSLEAGEIGPDVKLRNDLYPADPASAPTQAENFFPLTDESERLADEAADAADAAREKEPKAALRLEHVRWPWWAVDPALRPKHEEGSAHAGGFNSSAVSALNDGRSTWKLIL
jgi:hypothetical protein